MKQKKFSRRSKSLAIVFAVLIIVLFSINFFVSKYATKRLEAALRENEQYKFHFEDLRVNVFTGSASARNVNVSPSSSSLNDSIQRVNFSARSINLSGIGWYSLLFKKNICIGAIKLQHPVIAIKNFGNTRKGNAAKKHFNLYDIIHSKYGSLRIDKFEVDDGTISAMERDSANFFLASNSFSFELYDVVADSITARACKAFEISNATASLKNIHGNFTKGMSRLTIPSVTFSTRGGEMNIDSLIFSPTIDKTLFAKKLGHQETYRDIMMAGVQVRSRKFLRFIEQQEVLIDTIEVGYFRVYNYRDRNLPRKFTRHVLHHTFLDSLHFKIDLQKVKIDDGNVTYESLNVGAIEPGHIDFDSIRFVLSKFSNINMNDTVKVDISCIGMSQAIFRIHMLLPLAKDEFYTSGTMGPHEMAIWNPILKNYTTPIEIKSGQAKSCTFSFAANTTKGIGAMTFIYSDLKVNTLNKQYEKSGVKNSVKTFVANRMILEKDNPDDNVLRIGNIDYDRNPGRNFISYVYHMIFNGMESSVGLKEEKMNKKMK